MKNSSIFSSSNLFKHRKSNAKYLSFPRKLDWTVFIDQIVYTVALHHGKGLNYIMNKFGSFFKDMHKNRKLSSTEPVCQAQGCEFGSWYQKTESPVGAKYVFFLCFSLASCSWIYFMYYNWKIEVILKT